MKNIYFKGKFFTKSQMREILKGLSDRVDADIYAKPSYTAQMMRKIRFALIKK